MCGIYGIIGSGWNKSHLPFAIRNAQKRPVVTPQG